MKPKKTNNPSRREGAILVVVLVIMVVLTVLVLTLFNLGYHSARETEYELKNAQAFWLAEAGRKQCVADLYNGGNGVFGATAVGSDVLGTFQVIEDPTDSAVWIAIGTVTVGGQVVTRRIRMEMAYVARPFEDIIHSANRDGTPWDLLMRGEQENGIDGPPLAELNQNISGGNDVVVGNLNINGGVRLYDQSLIKGLSNLNPYNINGDVIYSQSYGNGIYQEYANSIEGTITSTLSSDHDPADFATMDYVNNNDYDIAQIFLDAWGDDRDGLLPDGHPLRDVVVKNPSDRSEENAATPADDFYFEPSSVSGAGTPSTGVTPLSLGDDKVYYVDGHVWFHHKSTYGFKMDGQAVIVSTRDIHISDNISYADPGRGSDSDMLALVALGQLDSVTGDYDSAGNIYFGDPRYGTLYTGDAFMFANNNFFYNTDSTGGGQVEPESGFKIFGNFMAMNQVVVLRDWYTNDNNEPRAAEFVLDTVDDTWKWVDSKDWRNNLTTLLTPSQETGLRHYAMQVEYDDRMRDVAVQMSGLPRGNGNIFAGMVSWEELSP